MVKNNMIAMILAGGRGSRLYDLTEKIAKPAVSFGGKYRIIDFPLSNCANSDVDVVAVLTQYESIFLNSYVAQDQHWGLDARESGIYVLPPREKTEGFGIYRGTADAITQNIDFLDQHNPEYVLILSGDHIYKMDYSKMLKKHRETEAKATIAVLEVSIKEASRFGIMNTNEQDQIIEFEEKPAKPKSNLASMGIYIFDWKLLRKALVEDEQDEKSSHDFGKDIIPRYLNEGWKLQAYRFKGYWKDVGTVTSLWESNMDLLDEDSGIDMADPNWKIYTEDVTYPPHSVGENASVKNSLINQGSRIDGTVENCVVFENVRVEEGAVVRDTVLSANTIVRSGAKVRYAIVMEDLDLSGGHTFGGKSKDDIVLVTKQLEGVK